MSDKDSAIITQNCFNYHFFYKFVRESWPASKLKSWAMGKILSPLLFGNGEP